MKKTKLSNHFYSEENAQNSFGFYSKSIFKKLNIPKPTYDELYGKPQVEKKKTKQERLDKDYKIEQYTTPTEKAEKLRAAITSHKNEIARLRKRIAKNPRLKGQLDARLARLKQLEPQYKTENKIRLLKYRKVALIGSIVKKSPYINVERGIANVDFKRNKEAATETKIHDLIGKPLKADTSIKIEGGKHGSKGELAKWKNNTWQGIESRKRVYVYDKDRITISSKA